MFKLFLTGFFISILSFTSLDSVHAGTLIVESYDVCDVSGEIIDVDFTEADGVFKDPKIETFTASGSEPIRHDRFTLSVLIQDVEFMTPGASWYGPDVRVSCKEAYPKDREVTMYITTDNVTNEEQLRQSQGKVIKGVTTQYHKEFETYQITESEPRNWLQKLLDWIKSLFGA